MASSTPTFQCTPIFGGDPASCTKSEHDALEAQIAEYADAQRIYTQSLASLWDLMEAKRPATKELLSTASGEYRDSLVASLRDNQTSDLIATGEQKITWMKPASLSHDGSTLVMRACVGPGTLTLVAAGGPVKDTWFIHSAFFKEVDGDLLISAVRAEVVESC